MSLENGDFHRGTRRRKNFRLLGLFLGLFISPFISWALSFVASFCFPTRPLTVDSSRCTAIHTTKTSMPPLLPPLHHPGIPPFPHLILIIVPVHPIPPVRSPPTIQPYNPNYQPNPSQPPVQPKYAQQFGQYLGVNDATAQMSLHVMGNVMGTSQEYVSQNVLRFLNTRSLKPYFNVSSSYVLGKLRLLVFPWRHKPWSRQMRRNEVSGAMEYKPPREDINAPDLYIPGTSLPLVTGLIQ